MEIKKGQEVVAVGNNKRFKVEKISDGMAHLKEIAPEPPPEKELEERVIPEDNLKDSASWQAVQEEA